jgi:hypothetical protein
MTTPHRATPDQWHNLLQYLKLDRIPDHLSITLELAARIKDLEAAQQIRVFSAEEVAPIVVPASVARPAGLVERVAEAMQPGTFDWSAYEDEARAAIREVAAASADENPFDLLNEAAEHHGWDAAVAWLEQEADRG